MIRATEALYDPSLLELTPTAIAVIDARGLIRNFNSKACEFWGQSPKLMDSDHRFAELLNSSVLTDPRCQTMKPLSEMPPVF